MCHTRLCLQAVMALSADDMQPERLGCALGFYFGWFKNNVAGRDVCKGADFEVEILGDVLTLKGTIRAVPPEQAGVELAGDIQIAPATTYFQGTMAWRGAGWAFDYMRVDF